MLKIRDNAVQSNRRLEECVALQIQRLWYKYRDNVVNKVPVNGEDGKLCNVKGGWVPSGKITVVKSLGMRSYLIKNFSNGFCKRVQQMFSFDFGGLEWYDRRESCNFKSSRIYNKTLKKRYAFIFVLTHGSTHMTWSSSYKTNVDYGTGQFRAHADYTKPLWWFILFGV